MAFITSADYKPQIRDSVMTSVIDTDITTRTQSEVAAIEEMKSYLNQKFDVDAIFAQTADDRNPLLLMYLVDMVIYHLHARIPGRDVPETRKERYRKAIEWLNSVAEGFITPNLPIAVNDEGEPKSTFRFGSNPKMNHQW